MWLWFERLLPFKPVSNQFERLLPFLYFFPFLLSSSFSLPWRNGSRIPKISETKSLHRNHFTIAELGFHGMLEVKNPNKTILQTLSPKQKKKEASKKHSFLLQEGKGILEHV